MIDIHCHLLPGIDDGAKSIEQAISLVNKAVSNGITHMVVTPHIHPGRYQNSRRNIEAVFNELKSVVQQQSINLQLGYAAEVRLSPEIIDMIGAEEIPFHGMFEGKQVMLLELPSSHIPPGSEQLIKWLLDQGICPMIAHPERNRSISHDIDKLSPFVEMGCLFQLTASSVAGQFGERAERTSKLMLKKGLVKVIASDAHNLSHRPPRLDHGRDAAAKIIGLEGANKLVLDNPLAIVASQF